jgi:hypothetical protein
VLRDSGNEPVQVEQLTADDPAFFCQSAPGPGARTALRIRVDREKLAANALQTTVKVQVSNPAAQTVVIPVTFVIAR